MRFDIARLKALIKGSGKTYEQVGRAAEEALMIELEIATCVIVIAVVLACIWIEIRKGA